MSDPFPITANSEYKVVGKVPRALDAPCNNKSRLKGLSIELDGQALPSLLKVDNNDLSRTLTFSAKDCGLLTLTVENNLVFETIYVPIKKDRPTQLSFAEILQHVPLGSKVKVTIYDNNGYKVLKRIGLNRSAMDLPPDPTKGQREITPLYQTIAQDLKDGKPLIINAHVVLWDWQFTGAGKGKNWAIGDQPETNLYWGGGYGIYTMLKKSKQWQLVKDDKKQAVFKRTFTPNKAWHELGVTKPFDVYAVLDAHHAEEITNGYTQFANELYSEAARNVTLADGSTIAAGGQSHVLGLIGHVHMPEGPRAIQLAKQPITTKKGVFMTTCLSAPTFANELADENIFGLLFNTQFIAPEGYTFLPLFESIAQARTGKQLVSAARSGYQQYHQQVRIPSRFFVNAAAGLDKFMQPFDGDLDQDGINNRLDPDVRLKNDYEIRKNSTTIFPYNAPIIEIQNR